MRKLIVTVFLCCANFSLAQYTLIPDVEFEQRLIWQGIDTEGILDGQILTDDIDHVTVLDVSTMFPELDPTISDLTGIEDFTDLEILYFASNTVEQVDLSQNLNLKRLVCKFNNLTSLDVSNNLLLENLDLSNCFPGTCDQENTFSIIDLSNNVNLKSFHPFFNFFEELDFSNNPQLESLSINYCSTLTSLNIKNGNNINLNIFNVIENPNLTCITVDDPEAASQGDTYPYDQWNIQDGIIFSEDCSLGIEEAIANQLRIYPNPVENNIYIQNQTGLVIDSVTLYDTLGRKVFESKEINESIDLSNLTPGVYFLHITTEHGMLTQKIIKE